MAAAKRVRWDCPHGLHAGVLGSTRPPRDSVVRFCLECSKDAGRLVERSAPALERKRAIGRERQSAKQQREQAAAAAAREAARKVAATNRAGEPVTLDVRELLEEAWRTDELRAACVEAFETFPRAVGRARKPPVPELVIRAGTDRALRARMNQAQREGCSAIRLRDALSGHCDYGGRRIVMTVGPTCGEEWLRAIVVHEAAHAACALDERHGRRWRTAYIRAVRELYGVIVPNEGANWQLDEAIAAAIMEAS